MSDTTFPPVDVAVIGAGMAGLSTAVHARLSGLWVRVFERHTIPGGLCTSWRRNGYVFDYCVEYFVGSGKGLGFYGTWKDLGIIEATEFRHIDSFGRYVGENGRFLELYTDYRRLREHMLAIAPEDTERIGERCEAIRKTNHFVMTEFSFSREAIPRLVGTVDFPTAGPILVFGLMSADKVGYPRGLTARKAAKRLLACLSCHTVITHSWVRLPPAAGSNA